MKKSALFYACGSGCLKLVKLLLTYSGVDVNVVSSDGMTPVMNAAKHGHINIIEVLINSGARVSGETTVSVWIMYSFVFIVLLESNDSYGVCCSIIIY